MSSLWSSLLVLEVMFVVAAVTAARRSQVSRGSAWLTAALAAGFAPVVSILLVSRAVSLTGVAIVPVFGIVLGGTMRQA